MKFFCFFRYKFIYLLVSFLFLSQVTLAQLDSINKRQFGIAESISLVAYASIPDFPITTNVFLKCNNHVFFGGIDLYSLKKNIYGLQSGYQYHFNKRKKSAHLFFESNVQYVTFFEGAGSPQSIYFRPKYEIDSVLVILKIRTLVFSSGLGIEWRVASGSFINLIIGTGISINDSRYVNTQRFDFKEGLYIGNHLLVKSAVCFNVSSLLQKL